MPSQLTYDRLIEVLDYNKDTGIFVWKIKTSKKNLVGNQAGCKCIGKRDKKIMIGIDRHSYSASRLAWFYEYKTLPQRHVEHINGDGFDNRILNLRLRKKAEDKKKPTYDWIKKILKYDPKTGVFTWITTRGRNKLFGSEAGYVDSRGYVSIGIKDKLYYAHRLAWFFVYGYFPEHGIDHINKNPSDNRIDNLRAVSAQCNARNSSIQKNNKSGVKGVCFIKNHKKWFASIVVNNKQHGLGFYKSFENAVCARYAAEQCLNWNDCDVDSSAGIYVKKNIIERKLLDECASEFGLD